MPRHEISCREIIFRKKLGNILYFHGNAGNITWYLRFAEKLVAETGWNVWMVDYPGFGKSSGSIKSESSLKCVAREFTSFVIKMSEGQRVKAFGYSMGTFLAAYSATEYKLDGLILHAPYYDAYEQVQYSSSLIPKFFLRYQLETSKYVASSLHPILILHGDKDNIVSIRNSERLFAIAPAKSIFVPIANRSHHDLDEDEKFWIQISRYVSSLL